MSVHSQPCKHFRLFLYACMSILLAVPSSRSDERLEQVVHIELQQAALDEILFEIAKQGQFAIALDRHAMAREWLDPTELRFDLSAEMPIRKLLDEVLLDN